MTQQEIENIKAQTYLPDIVAENITLCKSGNGFVGCCPFHGDKSPSLHLFAPTSDKGYWTYKCFGCGKSGDAIQYLIERDNLGFSEAVKNLAQRVNVPVTDKSCQGTKKTPSWSREQPTNPFYLGIVDVVINRQSDKSDFCRWLATMFPSDEVKAAVERYHLGTTNDGHVIFWRIDAKGFVRSGKIMKYGSDGHRLRNGEKDTTDWIHARLRNQWQRTQDEHVKDIFKRIGKANPIAPDKWQLNQTLFGLHILHDAPKDTPLCIVESEKTAVIMSIIKPDFIWLSCGGYSMLDVCLENSRDVLKGRRIMVFPDKSKNGYNFFAGWKEICARYSDLNLGVTDLLERSSLNGGDDIADLYLAAIQPQQPQPVKVNVNIKFNPLDDLRTDTTDWGAEIARLLAEPQPQECPF